MSGSRVTFDVGLAFTLEAGGEQARRREGPGGLVLVESKTVGVAATADTVLWRLGQRPMPLSKYCIGMALMRPDLPANRWNRSCAGTSAGCLSGRPLPGAGMRPRRPRVYGGRVMTRRSLLLRCRSEVR